MMKEDAIYKIRAGLRRNWKRILSFRESKFARRFARKSKIAIIRTFRGMGQEIHETKLMARLFFRLLESKLDLENRKAPPTREEVKEALEQLKDVGRFSVFTSISLLPGGGFSLIGLEILARRFGISQFTFVPSAFRRKKRHATSDLNKQEKKLLKQLPEFKAIKEDNISLD